MKKSKKTILKSSKDFGKKEKVLNFACQNYQLSRPSKVGPVMELIRQCQPKAMGDWVTFYFKEAYTKNKNPIKVDENVIIELGERLYEKITEVVIPEWTEAFKTITKEECIEYIYNLVICRTYDGFITEKSVINDNLVRHFPKIIFKESDSDLDHAGDIDYLGFVNESKNIAFGIQIKPITNRANFGNYNPSERMKNNFQSFKKKYKGDVFVVYSINKNGKKEIINKEIIAEIQDEIKKLENL